MRFGYARVSTKDQNLDMQIDALKAAGCDEIVTEKMSGARGDRPELTRLLDKLRKGDVLVVYKLDRLGRSTKGLIDLTDDLEGRGVELVSIRDNIDTTTPIGRAMMRMLMVLAEMEREIIVERTQAGLKAARARGRVGGRRRVEAEKVQKALKLYDTGTYSIAEIVEMTGISKATIFRRLKEREKSEV